jgi:hypothetical protein|tara:strand:+ start:635 stop:799 length:165 start_codon:yes stop_codon:yes gene_type:complete
VGTVLHVYDSRALPQSLLLNNKENRFLIHPEAEQGDDYDMELKLEDLPLLLLTR